jgi:predicted dehydrogenase
MKQLLQSVRTGEVTVVDAPAPQVRRGHVLVQTTASLISAGTERMVMEFASKSLLDKARARPDLVRQVLDKAQREGFLTTLEAVRSRLDQPLSLGYSSAGEVLAVGDGVEHLRVGDRVACAGGGYAVHAEIVSVPQQLVARVPDSGSPGAPEPGGAPASPPTVQQTALGEVPTRIVTAEGAAFTTLGAIALHGFRLAEAKLGEVVAVIGLGLLGQLTVQIVKAAGCRVVGMDIQPARAELARQLGVDAVATTPEDLLAAVQLLTGGHGADAVLLTADTPANGPVEVAGQVARDRGVVVAIGAVGMQIPRKVYYEKELDFRISRSYGPGRYDPEYEQKGRDYPFGYVRWTENRNMQGFLRLLADGHVQVQPLISHRFSIEDAPRAYDLITGKAREPFLGVLIVYPARPNLARRLDLRPASPSASAPASPGAVATVGVGMLGAGNFAITTLLPAMKQVRGVELVGVSTASGLSARHAGDKFGFRYCATDEAELLNDPAIQTLVVATRHDLHAQQAIAALHAGKDVFVEKPLAMNRDELVAVMRAQQQSGCRLMVGFNRRFAPMVQELARFVARRRRPLVAVCRVNAGAIPAEHWTQDPTVGGGRIVGEACHFVDLLQFLVGAPPRQVYATAVQTERGPVSDEVVITLTFADGSVGTVVYAAGGDKSFSKERVEILGDGRVAALDDYRLLEMVHNGKRRRRHERLRPDKGHQGEWQAIVAAAVAGVATPIGPPDLAATHLATYAVLDSLRTGQPVPVDTDGFWHEVSTLAVPGLARE